MTRTPSLFRNPLIYLTMLAGGVPVTGCVDSPGLVQAADTEQSAIVDDQQIAALLPPGELRDPDSEGSDATLIAVQGIATPTAVVPMPPGCTHKFEIGPSSPITGFNGAAAHVIVTCVQKCHMFVSTVRICTDTGCDQVQSQAGQVCATPVRFGAARPGLKGANCSGAITLLPPGVGEAPPVICG